MFVKQTILNITKRLLLIVAGVTLLTLIVSPEISFAQLDDVRRGVGATGDATDVSVPGTVETVINIFSYIVGIISVIMIIIGGLKYITSAGDASNVSSAKNTILYAVIGLVIVALAQVIVIYVLDTVEGASSMMIQLT